jgi:hypothetical protein
MGLSAETFTQRARLARAEALRAEEPEATRRFRLLGDAYLEEAARLQLLATPLPEDLPPPVVMDLQRQAARAYVCALAGPAASVAEVPLEIRRRVLDEPDERWLEAVLLDDVSPGDADRLGRLARRLQAVTRPWEIESVAARWTRLRRLALVGILALGLLAAGARAVQAAHGADLAVGKKWRTSSAQTAASGTVPKSSSADYFFHTKEEPSPWFEIDLGSPMKVGSVTMENRRDCCFARALPVIVEVSDDAKAFREVAKTTEEFRSTRVSFPSTTARYVRLRVPHRSFLHLASVGVFPR